MRIKRNKTDIFILVFSLVFIACVFAASLLTVGMINGKNKYVVIRIDNKDKFKYKLDEDRVIELKQSDYPTLLGDMIIEIKDSKVRVQKEESPKNYCSKQGWVSNVGLPIVCLPNSVVITIVGTNDSDMDWQV